MIKGYWLTKKVFIGDKELLPDISQRVKNHSPDGFSWSYGGSGPSQLALALMLHYTKSEEKSLQMYQKFKWEVIANLPDHNFEMDEQVVKDFLVKYDYPSEKEQEKK